MISMLMSILEQLSNCVNLESHKFFWVSVSSSNYASMILIQFQKIIDHGNHFLVEREIQFSRWNFLSFKIFSLEIFSTLKVTHGKTQELDMFGLTACSFYGICVCNCDFILYTYKLLTISYTFSYFVCQYFMMFL